MFRFLIRFFPRLVTSRQFADFINNDKNYSERIRFLAYKEIVRRLDNSEFGTL